MIIGYVSPTNPFTDRKAWSGLTYKVRESIERAGYDIIWIPYKTVSPGNLKDVLFLFCTWETFSTWRKLSYDSKNIGKYHTKE